MLDCIIKAIDIHSHYNIGSEFDTHADVLHNAEDDKKKILYKKRRALVWSLMKHFTAK